MRPAYVVGIAILAFAVGTIHGMGRGSDSADAAWRAAFLKVPDERCRDAVRDALRSGE